MGEPIYNEVVIYPESEKAILGWFDFAVKGALRYPPVVAWTDDL
jgi:hypothetical protein